MPFLCKNIRERIFDMNCPIYDCFDTDYKYPFGAAEQFSDCKFSLRFEKNIYPTDVVLVMYRPGFKEKFIPLEKTNETDEYNEFTCIHNPQDLGLHQYYFVLTLNGNRRYIKRHGASEGIFEGEELFQLTVYKQGLTTPEWLKGGVMYQIFPDRFSKGRRAFNTKPAYPSDRKLHSRWSETPDWRPDHNGLITNNDYFGGDLKGIEQKLDYLRDLGVTIIYLNPIFESHENHRYSTANYEKIDPMLGTEADFRQLCRTAESKGIKIILDGVFSHTGADSIYFNKFGRYGESTGAYRDSNSKYKDWYSFIRYPDTYESWWGITTLPNVNENNPSYTEYICGNGGILQKWIDAGASGWRLDVADELPDEFLDNLRKAVKAKGEDKVIYGEVWEDASNKESYGVRRRYLTGYQLDSVMNYPFKEIILNYVKYSDPKPLVDGIMTIVEHYPKPCVDVLMNFLSTHDTERAITRLAGEEVGWHDREWQSERYLSDWQYVYGITLMKCAMVLQFFLPGIPCVYYGDEAGQEGYKDPFNRRTYPWGSENFELVDFTRELSAIRHTCKGFARGDIRFIKATRDYVIFRRFDDSIGEGAVVFLNKSKNAQKFSLTTAIQGCTSFRLMRSKHGGSRTLGKIMISPFDYEVVEIKTR